MTALADTSLLVRLLEADTAMGAQAAALVQDFGTVAWPADIDPDPACSTRA